MSLPSSDPISDSNPVSDSSTELTFRQLKISEPILRAVESSGYTIPTPIQAETIPLLLEGRDVLGQAQTGTGKTAAFAIPMLERIDLEQKRPQVLVLAPTRELAIQVAESFERYAANMRGLRVTAIYGGSDYQPQFRELDRGVHVVVGTPGRVMDHMRRGSLKLDGLKGLVLDEADEMLRMGFAEDVQWILTQSPAERQIALFSATLPEPIRQIARQHLRNPAQITIKQKTATADTIRQRFVIAAPHQKEMVLGRVLEAEAIDGAIIFVKMKCTSEPLAEYLCQCGHRAAALNGDIPQKQRERIVENLKSGRLDIIVATDVAARGLDVQRISHVINYDLPFDSEAYVHRIGRTGRAGRSGEAILFVHPRERGKLKRLEHATRQPIELMETPTNRVINKQRVAKFHEKINTALTHPELDSFASIVEQFRRDKDLPIEKIAAALVLLANGDAPLLLKDEIKQANFSTDTRSNHGDSRSRHGDRPSHSRDRSDDRRDDRRNDRRPERRSRQDEDMETFRIEVGHMHQVKPGNIVGAIANEASIDSSMIGRIEIFDDFSTVDLPEGMPRELFQTLKNVWVAGQKLNISRVSEGRSNDAPQAAHKVKTKKKRKKPEGVVELKASGAEANPA